MAYVGIEFPPDDGGGVALVHKKWLTPRRKEVWWPPFKQQVHFIKSLKTGASPDENWKLYKVVRSFFEEENFIKASKKLKQAENLSDIQSEVEELPAKRTIKRRALFSEDSSSDNNDTPVKKSIVGLGELIKKKKSLLSEELGENKSNRESSQETQSHLEVSATLKSPEFSGQKYTTEIYAGTSSATVSDDLGKTLLTYLVAIKSQTSQILARINEKEAPSSAGVVLNNIPVELPVKSLQDITILEEYLHNEGKISTLAAHCANFGGRDLTNKVNVILRNLITNKVAVYYNFCGSRGGKRAFGKLKLKSVVTEAILLKSPATSIHQIENQIKIWLKHAPKRVDLEERHNKI